MKSKILVSIIALMIISAAVISIAAEDNKIIDNSKQLFKDIGLFADSITLISTDYVEAVKVKDLVYGAIRGMMDTLDGYSQFLDPESFQEITEETKGEFGGIGIEIGIRKGVLTVIAPMEDTPAYEVGIKAGDKIVKIDDKITEDMTLDDAVKMLRGKPGTEVKLSMVRKDAVKILDFNIKRAIIKLKSIKKVKIIEDDIGYVRIVEFQERTAGDLSKNITELRKKGAKSLIIDLRNNPGGLLNSSVDTADLFLSKGTLVVYTEGRNPEKKIEFRAKNRSKFDDMNIVILVNKGSASAAEILAGAIKDNKRGLVIGVSTFGKGSVQTVIPLKDKSALRLTTAAYFTPSGKSLRDKGIEPDIIVKRKRLVNKKKDPEKKKEEEQKAEVFSKVKEESKNEESKKEKVKEEKAIEELKDKNDEKKEKPEEYDNQLQAAVNILKGVSLLELYKSAEQKSGEHPTE